MTAANKPEPAAFRLVAADELGQLKVIEVPAGPKWEDARISAVWGAPDRAAHITALCSAFASGGASSGGGVEPSTASSWVAAGRLDGRVQVFDGASGREMAAWCAAAPQKQQQPPQQKQQPQASSPSRVVGLHFAGPSTASALGGALVCVTASGDVAVFAPAGDGGSDVAAWQEHKRFKAAASVTATALSGDGKLLAVGGEGCQLSLWDVASGQRAWQAKGGKPNALGLVDLAHVTAAAFVEPSSAWPGGQAGSGGSAAAAAQQESAAEASAGERRVLVAGTHGHKLLVYDTAAGRRPRLEVAWREARVTALAAAVGGDGGGGGGGPVRVWAANGAGAVEALDLAAGRMAGALKSGASGSVRALALLQPPSGGASAAGPLVASAGLDRFVRVHSAATRTCLARVYLKQQLTAVAWLPPSQQQQQQQQQRGGDIAAAVSDEKQQQQRRQRQHSNDDGGEGSDGAQKDRQSKGKRKGGGVKGSSGAAVVDKNTLHAKKKHKR